MPDLRLGVPALVLSVLAITVVMTNAAGQNDQKNPPRHIPRTWDDEAIATLEVPLADAGASPVPVSADYYYRIPVRPIYKTYPVYHPSREPSGYFITTYPAHRRSFATRPTTPPSASRSPRMARCPS